VTYDLKLAERVRSQLAGIPCNEIKMFGGVGFLVHGNMTCGVHKSNLVMRVDPEKHNVLLKKPHAKPFDLTGRPMKGWLVVAAEGCKTEKQLSTWIKESIEFALTLPPK
jgi:TfoX/Sxy family transcriptional regulator of competence genes